MRSLLLGAPLLLAVQQPPAADPSAAAPATPDASTPLTATGWGAVRIGMSRAELEAALGPDDDLATPGGPNPAYCDQFHPARAPQGVVAMVERDRLTRLTLTPGAAVKTDRGVGPGASAAEVRAAYGATLKAEPNEYVRAPGEYLTHWAVSGGPGYVQAADARGIRYEIGADGRVSAIHAGGPSIQYTKGCG
jgi:hypothetical protein